jgi:hypothetical protein
MACLFLRYVLKGRVLTKPVQDFRFYDIQSSVNCIGIQFQTFSLTWHFHSALSDYVHSVVNEMCITY